jgi:hypothetical protein
VVLTAADCRVGVYEWPNHIAQTPIAPLERGLLEVRQAQLTPVLFKLQVSSALRGSQSSVTSVDARIISRLGRILETAKACNIGEGRLA